MASQAQVAPDALVAALRALGVGEDLLSQIRTSIKPPAPKVERRGQRLLQLRGLIDSAKAHVVRLETVGKSSPLVSRTVRKKDGELVAFE